MNIKKNKSKLPTKKENNRFNLAYKCHFKRTSLTALGDSLIKGLTEVAHSRPSNPVKFLADYLHTIADHKKSVISSLLSCFFFFFISNNTLTISFAIILIYELSMNYRKKHQKFKNDLQKQKYFK